MRRAHTKRVKAALRVSGRLRRFAAAAGRARAFSLARACVLSKWAYGAKAYGMAPTEVLRLRRTVAAAGEKHVSGRCLTTALALMPGADPGVQVVAELMRHTLQPQHDASYRMGPVG